MGIARLAPVVAVALSVLPASADVLAKYTFDGRAPKGQKAQRTHSAKAPYPGEDYAPDPRQGEVGPTLENPGAGGKQRAFYRSYCNHDANEASRGRQTLELEQHHAFYLDYYCTKPDEGKLPAEGSFTWEIVCRIDAYSGTNHFGTLIDNSRGEGRVAGYPGEGVCCRLWMGRKDDDGTFPLNFSIPVNDKCRVRTISTRLKFGEWRHLAAVYDDLTHGSVIYLDGEPVAMTGVTSAKGRSTGFGLGYFGPDVSKVVHPMRLDRALIDAMAFTDDIRGPQNFVLLSPDKIRDRDQEATAKVREVKDEEEGVYTLAYEAAPAGMIVLAKLPTKAAQTAAFELQHHVELISGAELPIVREGASLRGLPIYVGDTEATQATGLTQDSFKPQEHAAKFSERAIYLVGRDDPNQDFVLYDAERLGFQNLPGFWDERGTLHAAYDFLEQFCGVRWLNPTDYGTVIPQTTTLAVKGKDLRRTPTFEYRDAQAACGNPGRYDAYIALWPRNSTELKAWDAAAYAELHKQFPNAGQYERARSAQARLFLLRMRDGGTPQKCNHSLYGYYKRFWNDPETRRPEMFAKGYEGQPPQMCYTSRALIEQVADDARHYYETGDARGIFWKPELPNWFPIEPMDNGAYCKCDACRKWLDAAPKKSRFYSCGRSSDYLFNFVNEVVKELHQTHPDRSVVTLAYSGHAERPTKVKLDPSVAVQFCFATNRGGVGSESYRHEIELVKAWADDGTKRPLYLWLYYTFPVEHARNANLHCWPGFFAHAVGEQMRLFAELGYRGMFHCGYGQEVEAYVTFRLMNDASLDVDELLAEYFTGLYGSAAEPMRKLYLEIERSHCEGAPKYTPERMEELAALLEQAQDLAKTDREKRNVELFDLSTWSYMVEGHRQRQEIADTAIPAVQVPRVPVAGGDVGQVAWDKAIVLPGTWYMNNSNKPAKHKLSGRVAHDGTHLYLELVDECETAKLTSSAMVFPFDDWEVFVARKRELPYRQYSSNPKGLTVSLSHGEVNFRRNVPIKDAPFKVVSDTSAADKWVTRMVWPMAEIVPGGIKPGGTFYLNVIRVWNLPMRTGDGSGIDAWAPFTKVHQVARLPELTLE